MDDGAALLKRVPVKGSQVRILFLPPIRWRRIAWIAIVWFIITNQGCFQYVERAAICNPLILSSCEP